MLTNPYFTRYSQTTPSTGVDVVRFDDHIELSIDLPGVDADSIDVTMDGRDLTITAERHTDAPEGASFVRRGRVSGTFTRTFHLSDGLDADGLSADFNNGVLQVMIPVAEAAKPRKIAVGVGAGTEELTAETA